MSDHSKVVPPISVARRLAVLAFGAWAVAAAGGATEGARAAPVLVRFPDAGAGVLVFVARGDLWRADRDGGRVRRLARVPGGIVAPHLSPDGRWVAFTETFGAHRDVWAVPASGGAPRRLTFDGRSDNDADNLVVAWTPDGRRVVFLSTRGSVVRKQVRAFAVTPEGGLPERLPLAAAGEMSFSPDGRRVAYNPVFRNFELRKRYVGGQHQRIDLYDFETRHSVNLGDWKGTDTFPMWSGGRIYFLSDRGPDFRLNLWVHDLAAGTDRQLTHFADHDIDFPSLGDGAITFQQGGGVWEYDLARGALRRLAIVVPDDGAHDRPLAMALGSDIRATEATGGIDYALAPDGGAMLFSAHGRLFRVSADGAATDLTRASGIDEDHPAFSPDGHWIASASDASGEQHLVVRDASGAAARDVMRMAGEEFHAPVFAPDGRSLLAADTAHRLWLVSLDGAAPVLLASDPWAEIRDAVFSPDGRRIAYSAERANRLGAIHLHEIATGRDEILSSPMEDDRAPAFSPDGDRLFFISRRAEQPVLSDRDDAVFAAVDSDVICAMRLDAASDGSLPAVALLPVAPGTIAMLEARGGSLFYRTQPVQRVVGDLAGRAGALHEFDVATGADRIVVDKLDDDAVSADGATVLFRRDGVFRITRVRAPGPDRAVDLRGVRAVVDPVRDWASMLAEAWRLDRDVFFSTAMNGDDWQAVGRAYRPLAATIGSEDDFLYWLGQMQGELASSHTFIRPVQPQGETAPAWAPDWGADLAVDRPSGAIRFAHVLRGDPTRPAFRNALAAPELGLQDGDWMRAVNGRPVAPASDPQSLLAGAAGPVRLSVSRTAAGPVRTATIALPAPDTAIRLHDWIEANRAVVDRLSGGRVGYVFLSDFSERGSEDFLRQYAPQLDRQGLVFDIRWNRGGFTSQAVLAILRRIRAGSFVNREEAATPLPGDVAPRAMAAIENRFTASDGDQFAYFFRAYGLGKLVGERSWGGVQGINDPWTLIDGTGITIPKDSLADASGHWIIENAGVAPDIAVESRPDEVLTGRDAQLEAAVAAVLAELAAHGVESVRAPARLPAYPAAGEVPGARFR